MTILTPRRLAASLPFLALGTPVTALAVEYTELATLPVHAETDDFVARRDAPTTRLVYGREELDRMNELTVGDYLRKLPGVTFTGPPGTPKDVRLRGGDKGLTQILIDGEPVFGGGKERQIQVDRIPLDLVERVEVIRAPSADLPNEGLLGTINIVLRDAPPHRTAGARAVGGRIFGEATDLDSWNLSGYYGNATRRAPGDAGPVIRYLLSGAVGERAELKTKTKDEQSFNASGTRTGYTLEAEDERVKSDGVDFNPRVEIELDRRDKLVITGLFSRTDEDKTRRRQRQRYTDPVTALNLVGNGAAVEDEAKRRDIARLRAEWRRKLAGGGDFRLFAQAQVGDETRDKSTRDFNPAGALAKTTLESEDKTERGRKLGGAITRPWAAHVFSAGLEFEDNRRDDAKRVVENGVAKNPGLGDTFDITEQRLIAWAQDTWQLADGHLLTPGLRWQRIEREGIDGGGNAAGAVTRTLSPSLHYLWNLSAATNLRASVSHTLKPPKFDDVSPLVQAASGANSLTNPDKGGTPGLLPEKALGYELGIEHFLPGDGGVLGVNAFLRDVSDRVEKRTEREANGRFVERPVNVGDAEIWGLEFDARPTLAVVGLPDLRLRFNYTRLYSEARDAKSGLATRIKDQPPYVYNVGFDWKLPRGWALGANYNYTPTFLKNPAEPTKPDFEPDQRLLDAYVAKKLTKTATLRVSGANLLDFVKDKDKREVNNAGVLTKRTLEAERGGPVVFVALEMKL
ncbi:MAG: TonB-dependent receptor plug domain-containing protein [Thiobacillus sp.]